MSPMNLGFWGCREWPLVVVLVLLTYFHPKKKASQQYHDVRSRAALLYFLLGTKEENVFETGTIF